MEIYFPSAGRSDDFMTIRRMVDFEEEIPYKSYIVCPKREGLQYEVLCNKYKKFFPLGLELMLIDDSLNLCQTRELLVYEQAKKEDKYILMIDDDLKFIRRIDVNKPSLRLLQKGDIVYMLQEVEKKMVIEGYAHVSIGDRFGNQNYNATWLDNKRSYRIYGFDSSVVVGEDLHYDIKDPLCPRFVMEDFHMTLSLIELGYPFAVYWEFCNDSPGSNTKGGLSSVRTLEVLKQSAEALHRLHPKYTKLVKKSTKYSWQGKERVDVNVRWKKAFCSREKRKEAFQMSTRGLEVKIEDDVIVIRLPISVIPIAAKGAFEHHSFQVTEPNKFAQAVLDELRLEAEDGTTIVHEMFDKGFCAAVENGADGGAFQ